MRRSISTNVRGPDAARHALGIGRPSLPEKYWQRRPLGIAACRRPSLHSGLQGTRFRRGAASRGRLPTPEGAVLYPPKKGPPLRQPGPRSGLFAVGFFRSTGPLRRCLRFGSHALALRVGFHALDPRSSGFCTGVEPCRPCTPLSRPWPWSPSSPRSAPSIQPPPRPRAPRKGFPTCRAEVVATYRGVAKSDRVSLGASGHREIHFSW